MSDKINETAVGGSTGGGSIAVRHDRMGGMQTRMSLKDFMVNFNKGVNNRYKFHRVNNGMEGSIKSITESTQHPYQVDDAVSRLKDMEIGSKHRDNDVITYGVEDDQGVMMKVTVPVEQGESFERYVAQSMADVQDYKKTGKGEDKSLAELLYELKDQFTIVNAEFPTIPKDAVYNADEITEDMPEPDGLGDDEIGDDELGGDELDADGDEEFGDEEFDPDNEEVGDDFDSAGGSKEDLLMSVLGMIKSQNEKEVAQAKAEEEKAKARQAELASKASQDEMQTQEQMIVAQAEMDAEKDREKRAKEMAELAKFNYRKKLGEGAMSSILRDVVLELDANDSVASLRRQMPVIMQKYRTDPNDDPETQQFKRTQLRNARRELRIQMQAAGEREDYESKQQDKEEQDQNQNQQQQQGSQNQQTRTNDRGPQ